MSRFIIENNKLREELDLVERELEAFQKQFYQDELHIALTRTNTLISKIMSYRDNIADHIRQGKGEKDGLTFILNKWNNVIQIPFNDGAQQSDFLAWVRKTIDLIPTLNKPYIDLSNSNVIDLIFTSTLERHRYIRYLIKTEEVGNDIKQALPKIRNQKS